MNDKSSIPAPQGGTLGSSQSVVREEKSPAQESLDERQYQDVEADVDMSIRQYREDVEAGVDMSTPAQESTTWEEIEKKLKDSVWANICPKCKGGGADGANTCNKCGGSGLVEWRLEPFKEILAQAKHQERERIMTEIENYVDRLPDLEETRKGAKIVFLSDLTDIINNHE